MICEYLNDWTEQQVFDTVAGHLLTQQRQAARGDTCFYRLSDTELKCAAGCLIPDKEYTRDLEGETWHTLIRNQIVPLKHVALICSLQRLHDEGGVTSWKDKLQIVAKDYGLEFKEKEYVSGG